VELKQQADPHGEFYAIVEDYSSLAVQTIPFLGLAGQDSTQ
jgi:hypothetical protein